MIKWKKKKIPEILYYSSFEKILYYSSFEKRKETHQNMIQ